MCSLGSRADGSGAGDHELGDEQTREAGVELTAHAHGVATRLRPDGDQGEFLDE